MLDTAAVADLARPILEAAVTPLRLSDIRVEETADLEGEDALDVLAIAEEIADEKIDARTDASVALQHALQAAGERRYAFVKFATPQSLAEFSADEDDE